MDLHRKLAILADAAKYDASCASSGASRKAEAGGIGSTERMGICHTYTPDGRCVSLLKVLLTNTCIYDCQYCVNRASSATPRARFTVREVVDLTLDFYRRNYIEGLFLSSGVEKGADATMEQVALVAKTLRVEHRFGGYIHLKATPGVATRLLDEAARWADRVSVNAELPTAGDLAALAPEKTVRAIRQSMATLRAGIDEARAEAHAKAPAYAPAGQTTQMIVGATDTSDAAILTTSRALYTQYALRRVYYSAYSPIPHADARLPPRAPPLVREHRLYEADWLLRHYGFDVAELFTPDAPNLDAGIDPKLAWALRNRAFFPIDVNAAPREALLRVPGLGLRTVAKILAARRHRAVTAADLARLRVPLKRCLPFVITADGREGVRAPAQRLDALALRTQVRPAEQLALFEAARGAIGGEL